MIMFEHIFTAFEERKDRYDFIREKWGALLNSSTSILDVGCDENYLKSFYGKKIYGIDIMGNPDKVVDLEKESLRFLSDRSYNLIICTEVLEHIDNLHEVFNDIVRVASGHILISLPNCSSTKRFKKFLRTKHNRKFYGLPFERPLDRHKWFFSYKEIIDFMNHQAEKHNLDIVSYVLHYNIIYKNEKRPLHKLKQHIESFIVRWFKTYNYSEDVFVLLRVRDSSQKL